MNIDGEACGGEGKGKLNGKGRSLKQKKGKESSKERG